MCAAGNLSQVGCGLWGGLRSAASLKRVPCFTPQVAKAFWMAIGGDRDEIEGLSSDEEH